LKYGYAPAYDPLLPSRGRARPPRHIGVWAMGSSQQCKPSRPVAAQALRSYALPMKKQVLALGPACDILIKYQA